MEAIIRMVIPIPLVLVSPFFSWPSIYSLVPETLSCLSVCLEGGEKILQMAKGKGKGELECQLHSIRPIYLIVCTLTVTHTLTPDLHLHFILHSPDRRTRTGALPFLLLRTDSLTVSWIVVTRKGFSAVPSILFLYPQDPIRCREGDRTASHCQADALECEHVKNNVTDGCVRHSPPAGEAAIFFRSSPNSFFLRCTNLHHAMHSFLPQHPDEKE